MANAWITFLTKYYQDRKKKQPGYSYSDAMKDAKIEYNKTNGTASSPSKSHKKGKKMRGGKGSNLGFEEVNKSTGPLVEESPEVPTTHKGGAVSVADIAESVNPEISMKRGKKSRRRKGTKGKKSRKTKSKKRKSRSSRK